jgi:hypothetical protein
MSWRRKAADLQGGAPAEWGPVELLDNMGANGFDGVVKLGTRAEVPEAS